MDSLLSIEKSLDDLEDVLAVLLDKPLSETVAQLELLQKAKMQVLLPYVVNDLVFIYLKTRGINPKTHPVVGELDRVKQYFDKIKKAEDPETRKFAVDQGAATRFIKHAIKESKTAQDQSQCLVKQGTHTRFTATTVVGAGASVAALAKIQARAAQDGEEESSSDEGGLEVFSDAKESREDVVDTRTVEGIGNEGVMMDEFTGQKRRRGMDPWTGYDDSQTPTITPVIALTLEERHQKRLKSDLDVSSDLPKDNAPAHSDIEKHGDVGEDGMVQKAVSSVNKAMGKCGKTVGEIIDVDTFSDPSASQVLPPGLLESTNSLTAGAAEQAVTRQVIDVDAIDSPRSSTSAQGKRKKKKKKQNRSFNI